MFPNALFICFQLFRSALTSQISAKKKNNWNNYFKKHIQYNKTLPQAELQHTIANNCVPWLDAQPVPWNAPWLSDWMNVALLEIEKYRTTNVNSMSMV